MFRANARNTLVGGSIKPNWPPSQAWDGGWFVSSSCHCASYYCGRFGTNPYRQRVIASVDSKVKKNVLWKRSDDRVQVIELERNIAAEGGQGGGRSGRDQSGNNCPLDHFKTVLIAHEIPDYIQHSSVLFNNR
ncbi:MAG: hypothetical protein JRE71_01115 [Deltaproteobacteria bacterium]|nr:hypothetical protein [Deltaproteobacteria bacterium]